MTDLDKFAEHVDVLSRAAMTPMDRPIYLTDSERDLVRLVVERYLAQTTSDPYMPFDARRHVEATGRSIVRKLGAKA